MRLRSLIMLLVGCFILGGSRQAEAQVCQTIYVCDWDMWDGNTCYRTRAITWCSPSQPGSGLPTDPGIPARLDLVSADIENDTVVVNPMPAGIGAQLKVTAKGAGGTDTVLMDEWRNGGQNYTVGFKRDSLPDDEFVLVEASWFSGDTLRTTLPLDFHMFSDALHTRYNTPHEVGCSGGGVHRDISPSANACTPVQDMIIRSGFDQAATLNGSGITDRNVKLQMSDWCNRHGRVSHYTIVDQLRGSHDIVDDNTAAKGPGDGVVRWGDRLKRLGASDPYKRITDTCPACDTGHYDNYTTSSTACSPNQVGGSANYRTIRLPR